MEYHDELSVSMGQKQEKTTMKPGIYNILDIPDEILRKIILHLNARERLPLGKSCQRFKSLVFEDAELLRDLDFSEQMDLTSATDIQQYFNNEQSSKYIRRINVRHVDCIRSGHQLNNSIGKAINVVDVNIHGIQFEDMWQLGCFLNPLIHIQRLSIGWPKMKDINIPLFFLVLKKPFSKLVYLSVDMTNDCLKVFISCLHLCHELRELHIVLKELSSRSTYDILNRESQELRNLEIIEYCGPSMIQIKELFVTLLPEPEKWTDFQLYSNKTPKGFYLEKNVKVCEELSASKWIDGVSNSEFNYFNMGWILFPELLLKELLKITYQNLPAEFCCLSTFMEGNRCLLKIEDAKQLLKNPKHQISYLHLTHPIELGCDAHLVASAFPNLTELVLHGITRNLAPSLRDTHFDMRRKRRASAVPGEQYETLNLDSSFKMLVENTPCLKHLTLHDTKYGWDLEQFHHISSWKNLETLRLLRIRIDDGSFLIEIAKQCKRLQKLELIYLTMSSSDYCCFKKNLFQMLRHCENLRDVAIQVDELDEPSEMFAALANNVQLRRLYVKNPGHENTIAALILSIKQLLYRCSKLTTFICIMSNAKRYDDLSSITKRWNREIGRPNFLIQLYTPEYEYSPEQIGTISKATLQLHPLPDGFTF